MPIIPQRRVPLATRRLIDAAVMREVGLMAIRIIQARTRQGRDADGQPFAPYAEGYAKAKAAAGYAGSGTVNLTLSGDMLNALQIIEVTDVSVTLGWTR
ncbi:hypothetical protein [Luteitalea sp.]|uniref:hypothetical protein n=1 Tax=Luteitalea sp. TaxID=2004800 RepID=UPI0025BA57BC|nr:hypothetical protein [Luteitalea sp.]